MTRSWRRGARAFAGLVAVAGLTVPLACSSGHSGSSAASTTAVAKAPKRKGPPPCWVGGWSLADGTQDIVVDGQAIAVTGGVGQRLVLSENKASAADYGNGTALRGTGPKGILLAQLTGAEQSKLEVAGASDKGGVITQTVTRTTAIMAISYGGRNRNVRGRTGVVNRTSFVCAPGVLVLADPHRHLHQRYVRIS